MEYLVSELDQGGSFWVPSNLPFWFTVKVGGESQWEVRFNSLVSCFASSVFWFKIQVFVYLFLQALVVYWSTFEFYDFLEFFRSSWWVNWWSLGVRIVWFWILIFCNSEILEDKFIQGLVVQSLLPFLGSPKVILQCLFRFNLFCGLRRIAQTLFYTEGLGKSSSSENSSGLGSSSWIASSWSDLESSM